MRATFFNFEIIIDLEQLEDQARLRISGAEAKPDTKDADLYRQLFIDLEQLEDPVRLRTPGAEAKPDTGDAALYRQLSTQGRFPNDQNLKKIVFKSFLFL